MPRPSLVALGALGLVLGSAATAQVRWVSLSPTPRPSKRSMAAMVWMERKAVLFGGENRGGSPRHLADTWTWDGVKWTRVTGAGPSARGGHAMAYDPIRKRVVLFSGWNGGSYVPDTWEFDGATWKRMAVTSPPPRDWAQMAFDPITKKVLLFGGHDWRRSSTGHAFDDTWTWDGKVWTKLNPTSKPSWRFGRALVLDEVMGTLLLVGGGAQDDLWIWIGTTWRKLTPKASPGKRFLAAVAYDRLRGRLVLHGDGATAGKADTWEWLGSTWVRRLASGGPAYGHAAACYDPVRREVVLFGGNRSAPTDAMWSYGTRSKASFTTYGAGCKGTVGVPGLSSTLAWVGEGFQVTLSGLPRGGQPFLDVGLSRTRWGTIGLPFDLGVIGAPGCRVLAEPAAVAGPLANRAGTATVSVNVPAFPGHAGVTLYLQGWVTDPGANRLGIVVSPGGALTIGAK